MSSLPPRPHLDHLKRQAKDLLRLVRAGDAAAIARIGASLPAARGKTHQAIAAMPLRLHDTQSCLAREYGFASWDDLRASVTLAREDAPHLAHRVLSLVYGVDEASERPKPIAAARVLASAPAARAANPIVACATGDVPAMRAAGLFEWARIDQPVNWTCPDCASVFRHPPLVAVTHSSLVRVPEFAEAIRAAARALLDAGADPNDHESLYHATESPDLDCVRLLLDAGARVEGTNALHHELDRDRIEGLRLLLRYCTDANDPESRIGRPLIWAIYRRRSVAHVETLLAAGADPHATTKSGLSAYAFASRNGLPDVAAALRRAGASDDLSTSDAFVATCASGDEPRATRLLHEHPDLIHALTDEQLRQLPNLAQAGDRRGVELMVRLGWPIAVTGGDWGASALNLAVFRGDAALARFLLEHGARWTERHEYNDNVSGTLKWASRNQHPDSGDWIGCAEALLDHGMPLPETNDGYSDELAAFFDERRARG